MGSGRKSGRTYFILHIFPNDDKKSICKKFGCSTMTPSIFFHFYYDDKPLCGIGT